MGARVAVAGASGYAGGELLRLLAGHPDLELGAVTADSNAGRPIAEVHPHLAGVPALARRTFDAADAHARRLAVTLPSWPCRRASRRNWPLLLPDSMKIVDLGPDFRLADAQAWARHYAGDHPGRWVCGLPERPGGREQIRAAQRWRCPAATPPPRYSRSRR